MSQPKISNTGSVSSIDSGTDISQISIRPIGTPDVGRLEAFFQNLSDQSRYRRFLSPVREVSAGLIRLLANADQRAHVAIAATLTDGHQETIIGEARYAVSETDPAICEFAVTIQDEWQGRGLGRSLLVWLEGHARAVGLNKVTAETLPDNTGMIGLARALGYQVTRHAQDAGLISLEKQLDPGASTW